MSQERVVITGVGLLSAMGNNLHQFCANLAAGHCAIRRVRIDSDRQNHERFFGSLPDIPSPISIAEDRRRLYNAFSLAGILCAERAMADTEPPLDVTNPDRAGVILGSGFINLFDLEEVYRDYYTRGPQVLSPLTIPLNMANAPVSHISTLFRFLGITKAVSTACSSGLTAVVEACRLIRDGYQDTVLAGGVELMSCPTILRSWEKLRILSPESQSAETACRPFDRDRNGLVLGEGGVLFLLESLRHAAGRGASPITELTGVYENSDGFDMLKPAAEGERICMTNALRDAGLPPDAIGMVQAHGTATRLNDLTEYESLRAIFGERLKSIPVCAIKSMIGHTMGASGAFNLAAALGSLEKGFVYPVPGFVETDDGTELNVTAKPGQRADVEHVMVNSFAFGGINCCVIASRLQNTGSTL